MKKPIAIILSICFVLCLTACSKDNTTSDVMRDNSQITSAENQTSDSTESSTPTESSEPTESSKPAESSKPTESSKPIEEKIAFSTNSIDLTVGATAPLKIETNIDVNNIVFSSSNENIAKYFGGEVLAKSKGECKIIATTPNGSKAECTITVSAKIVNTGKCGDNITWTYYDDYSLVFSGTGAMQEYYDDIWYQSANVLIPWHSYSPFVQEIIIEEGITSIAAFAFIDCKACKKITIPSSVSKIGYCAFEYWTNYEGFVLGKNITELGAMAFHSCDFNVYYMGTKEEFDAIKKIPPKDSFRGSGYDWSSKFKGKLLYYSEVQQSDCWRYVNGVPTAW